MARSRADLKVIDAAARGAPAAPRAPRGGAPATPAPSSTRRIVDAITTAIVERRLMPGTKLAEQQIADIFKVSRTLVRQALNQLSRDHLVTLEPARGAFVAQPSVEEARQVFEVRAMLEAAMVRQLCARITDAQVAELRAPPARRARRRGAHRRHRPHAAAGRLPRRAGAHAGQRGAGAAAGRPAVALLADRADVPVRRIRPSTRRTSTWPSSTRWSGATRAPRCRLMEQHLGNVERNLRLHPRVHDLAAAPC